jgi:hypothetical protein
MPGPIVGPRGRFLVVVEANKLVDLRILRDPFFRNWSTRRKVEGFE